MAYQEEPTEAELAYEAFEVSGAGAEVILERRRPFAVAVTAQVERVAVVPVADGRTDHVPAAGAQTTAMQEHNRVAARVRPFEVVETHTVDYDVVMVDGRDVRADCHADICRFVAS